MKVSRIFYFAPWVPPKRGDKYITVPPLPSVEHGGVEGCSVPYSDRISKTPHWIRMANSNYTIRMRENRTTYPLSRVNEGEYDIRYLPYPRRDPWSVKPLLEIGEKDETRDCEIPVIFLQDVIDADTGSPIGLKDETVYVSREFVREELYPQRFVVYATAENYKLLGLPVREHYIHNEIAVNEEEYEKIRLKKEWDEEPWKFTFDYLYRKYARGPPQLVPLLDKNSLFDSLLTYTDMSFEDWDGSVPLPTTSTSSGKSTGSVESGFVQWRKAKKVKLF